jgi:hypothetical protein
MQDLDRAISDIRAMRTQMARGAAFRFYGPATVALTGVLAIAAASVQSRLLPQPLLNISGWISLWVGTAVLCVLVIGAEVVFRARREHSGLADDMIQAAAIQLLPAAGAGIMLTLVLYRYAPAALWMLPGLWQILLSLGIFSACRNLPAALNIVAFWYLGAGLACLVFGSGAHALSPWAMGLPFGIGEALAAALLLLAGRGDAEVEDE